MTKRTILFLAANPRGTDPGGLAPARDPPQAEFWFDDAS